MGHDEAVENSLYDFIYLNHEALSLYNAQLDKDGLLTHSIITQAVSEQQKNHVAGSAKVISGGSEAVSGLTESKQNNFDTSRAMPLNVIRELNVRGLIQQDISRASHGQIVLFSGRLQIIDYALMASFMWPASQLHLHKLPTKTQAEKQAKKAKQHELEATSRILEQMPKLIQFRIFDDEQSAWGSISAGSMMVHSMDFVMKHSLTIPGQWHTLAVLDALPESLDDSNLDTAVLKYMTDLESGYVETFMHLRGVMGRRLEEYGITPLAIFRKVE